MEPTEFCVSICKVVFLRGCNGKIQFKTRCTSKYEYYYDFIKCFDHLVTGESLSHQPDIRAEVDQNEVQNVTSGRVEYWLDLEKWA